MDSMRIISFNLLLALCDISIGTPGTLIPLYAYPTKDDGSIWGIVKKTAINNPSVPFVAIVNPNSGPGTNLDPVYRKAIDGLVDAKIKCIGYVPTNYSNVPITTVTANMDRYKSWYPKISGFFFDEMANSGNHSQYYATLASYAMSIGYPYTVGNPGTLTSQSYFETVNNTVIYETNNLPEVKNLDLGFPMSRCSMIAYNVPATHLNQSYISEITKFVSLIYITDDVLDNPYDTLPSYFNQLICYLAAVGFNSNDSC